MVLTADHGEELFDHGGFEHGHSLHQELLHVPLVVWGPGKAALTPDPEEVEAAYLVSLRALHALSPRIVEGPEPERPLLTLPFRHPETVVYAPTAVLVYQMREVLLYGRNTRVDRFGEPRFAWR